MTVRRDFSCVALVAALLFALLPGVAAAAPTWLNPETLAGPGFTGAPDVTAFGDGQAAVVWTGFLPDESTHAFASVRPRGGPWGLAENLEPGGSVSIGDSHVVALPDGELIAVWRLETNEIRWARRPAGGDWSSSGLVASPCCSGLGDLVASADGSATVMWFDEGDPHTSTLQPGAAEWEPDGQLLERGNGYALAAAPDGGVAAVWFNTCSDFGDCVHAAYKPPGEDWGATEFVSEPTDTVNGVALVARPGGGFTAAWTQSGPPGAVRASNRAPGAAGAWQAVPQSVADLPSDQAGCRFGSTGCIDLAVGADGGLAAIWSQGPAPIILRSQAAPSGPAVAAAMGNAAGDWAQPEFVGDPGSSDVHPQVAIAAHARVAAAWVANDRMRTAWRAAQGGWTVTDLGAPGLEGNSVLHQDVDADDEGNAVTAWHDPAGVKASAFDGAEPRFNAFASPTAGSIGQPLSFSAAADDSWSSPTTILWDFGDSTGAAGNSVSHAYGSSGGFFPSARAVDALGNTAFRTGSLLSVPAAPPTCSTADKDKDGIGDSCDSNDGSTTPVPFKTVTVRVISGVVFIKLPAGAARASQAAPKGFVRLQGAATVPVGSTLDTSRGRIQLRSAADTRRKVQSGQFFDGRFVIRQLRKPRGKARRLPIGLITDLRLNGSSFSRCGAQASARSKRKVRRLWGDGKGSFRTTGRHAAATVRGTRWLVEDRCDGTLTRVRRGRVEVRDLERKRNVLVRAGHSYLARVR